MSAKTEIHRDKSTLMSNETNTICNRFLRKTKHSFSKGNFKHSGLIAAKLYIVGAAIDPQTAGGVEHLMGQSDDSDLVPCHNHTSSLLTTSQTPSLPPSQLSSGALFPTRKLDVVLPTGLCSVTAKTGNLYFKLQKGH
ncbi:hypothetical protein C0J52_21270 [Blattella germanica]|nr:hypothetical protein C0J52_21270 [Blattella germanica]